MSKSSTASITYSEKNNLVSFAEDESMLVDNGFHHGESSDDFKNFKKEHPDAYLSAGFFVIDFAESKDQNQLDYSLKDGKVFTFAVVDGKVTFKEAEVLKKENLTEIKKEIKSLFKYSKKKMTPDAKKFIHLYKSKWLIKKSLVHFQLILVMQDFYYLKF
jgi:hypothetical protein